MIIRGKKHKKDKKRKEDKKDKKHKKVNIVKHIELMQHIKSESKSTTTPTHPSTSRPLPIPTIGS